MKTYFRSKLLSVLFVLVMVLALVPVSALTAFAAGGTGTKDDPVICSTYSDFKAAMEDPNIRFVELKNCNEILPKISGNELIAAISVAGIKHLSLTGNNVFTVSADSDGCKSYDSLLHLAVGSSMSIDGGGSLTFKANLNNGRNAVIYNQGGSIVIYSGTLKGSYNTAVYGMAIWQEQGTLEIIDGNFVGDSAIQNNNPKYSVYLEGGNTRIRGGSFTSVSFLNTQAPLYGLCIETGAILDISGGEFDGILLPSNTTPMSNYVQSYRTVLVNESPIDATSINCQALVGNGKSVRVVALINEIKINAETPMAGMNISDLPITLGGGYSFALYYPQWHKNGEYVSSNGTFEQGANYSVVMLLERNKTYNYEFAPDVTATVNGETVAVNKASGLNKSQFVEITYNFGVCCDRIDTVNLNVSPPVEHQTHGMVTRPSGVTSYTVNDTYWYMSDTGNDGTWVSMPDNHQFTAGKYYKVSVDVKASDGYLFNINQALDPDITGNINGYFADVSRVYEQAADEYVCLTYNFGVCNDSVIEKIAIDNITAPVAGEPPSYSLSIQGSAYKSEGNSGFHMKNGVQWTDLTNGNGVIYDDTEFIPGHTYQVTIYLHAEENYTFATTGGENYPATTATVNGNAATVVNNGNSSKYQTVTYEFVCPKKNISSFEIGDLSIPQADETPDTSATTPYPEYYEVESVTWYNTNKTQMETNAKFEGGKSYLVEVKLIPGNYGANAITFSNNPEAFVNGEKVHTISEWDGIEIKPGVIYVRYTFPAIPLTDTPVNSYMVSYYPGEAEGSPDSDMIDEGTEITLTGCMFTAPEGKQFKAWAIGSANGEQKQPGEKITISEETYIIAIWKDVPITNYTITATAGANGTISPSGEVTVAEGTNKTFTITANSGYHIKDVKVNGTSVGAVATYTFENVSANATITVEFEVNTVPHVCNPTLVPKDEPECTTAGKNAYYHCECGKNYEDAQGNTEIANIDTWGILSPLDHNPSVTWSTDGEYHWKECTRCAGQQLEKTAHSGGTATCTAKAVCTTCNTAYGNTAAHVHSSEWQKNADEHWNECSCGDKGNVAAHADANSDGKCDACEYVMATITPEENNPNHDADDTDKPTEDNGNSDDNPADDANESDEADKDVEDESQSNDEAEAPSDDKSGLGVGAIATIVASSVVILGLGGFSIFWFAVKKKSFADLIAIFKKK